MLGVLGKPGDGEAEKFGRENGKIGRRALYFITALIVGTDMSSWMDNLGWFKWPLLKFHQMTYVGAGYPA